MADLERKTLREWRDAKFMTRGELAREMGVADKSVWNWEVEGREPLRRHQRKLAEVLGVRPEQILYVRDMRAKPEPAPSGEGTDAGKIAA